ncbi:hypothetical protein CCACVL1_23256 [Corchorus capsularis]|uniref:Uncharacterized protein n=1 Tax=Corchorus capsularis TaxID=210143 RepID=A0A1R3GUS4_COCAP|nr:hypothetical protein CCACVL1_23256 [Corchorus capsularis]
MAIGHGKSPIFPCFGRYVIT